MLTIRPEQIRAFSQAELQKFEEWMLAHLQLFFPKQCKAAGETQVRELIRYGVKRAAAYGITIKRDVCKYIDLMMVLGSDFDQDKRLPWAAEILARRRDPSINVQALHQAAQKHLRSA